MLVRFAGAETTGEADDEVLLIETALEDRQSRGRVHLIAAVHDHELGEDVPIGNVGEHDAQVDLGTLQMENFLAAVRGEAELACPAEIGYQSTATVQLGMIAYESGSVVQWDTENEQIVENPAATALLKREYRSPYVHPYQA